MTAKTKITILTAIFATIVLGVMLFAEPIPQWQSYHAFADSRPLWDIPNFGDVVSNLAFFLAGGIGLASMMWGRLRNSFESAWIRRSFFIYFIGVFGIGLGSGYYHWAPDDATLFWDRLPMTIAFMGIFTAVLADRLQLRERTTALLLPIAIAVGISSLMWWVAYDDLRLYAMVQFIPMVFLPAACLLFKTGRYSSGGYLIWMFIWYAIAKGTEHFDPAIFDIAGGLISGHTIKHIAAGIACYVPVLMLLSTTKQPQAETTPVTA